MNIDNYGMNVKPIFMRPCESFDTVCAYVRCEIGFL